MYLEAGVAAADQALAAAMATLAPLPLLHQPGSAWEDSVAPDVLARVVEVVSGQGFDRFLAAQVTGPLKMADTGYALAPAVQGRVAMPAVDPLTGAPPPSPDGRGVPVRMGGAGGLFSTAGDMLRFGQALLGGGMLDGVRLLGAGTVALMLGDHLGRISRETASGAYLLGEGRGYGLGLSVRLGAGVSPMPGSTGDVEWMGATGCQLVVDPEREMVAVLMVNQASQFDHLFRLFRTLVYQAIIK